MSPMVRTVIIHGSRNRILRKLAYVLDVKVDTLADALGYPSVRISKVLGELESSKPMLDKIDEYLTKIYDETMKEAEDVT